MYEGRKRNTCADDRLRETNYVGEMKAERKQERSNGLCEGAMLQYMDGLNSVCSNSRNRGGGSRSRRGCGADDAVRRGRRVATVTAAPALDWIEEPREAGRGAQSGVGFRHGIVGVVGFHSNLIFFIFPLVSLADT